MAEKKRNVLLLLVGLIVFFIGFEAGGFQLVLIHVAAEFGLDNTGMGALVATQYIAILAMPILFGHIADKVGKKKVLAIVMPIFVLGCLLTVLSNSAGLFIAGIFTVGAGYSASECIAVAALSDSDPVNASKNLNLAQSAFSLGAVVSPLLVSQLMQAGQDWRIVFIITGICFAALLPLMAKTHFSVGQLPPKEGVGAHKSHTGIALLKKPFLLVLLSLMILYCAMETGLGFFVDSFFAVQLQTPEFGAYALSLFWLGMTVTRIVFGMVKTDQYKWLMLLYGATVALSLLLAVTASAQWALVACALSGAAFGPLWPMIVGLCTHRYAKNTGTVTSILMAGGGAGATISPVLMGMAADAAGLRWSMGILVLFSVAAFALSMGLFQKQKQISERPSLPS